MLAGEFLATVGARGSDDGVLCSGQGVGSGRRGRRGMGLVRAERAGESDGSRVGIEQKKTES